MIEPLGASNPDSNKRGSPFQIDEEILFQRRDALLGILEFHWAEIAWELQKAESLKSIRHALQPVPNPRRGDLDLFLREPTQKAASKELRKLRKAKSGLEIEFRKALAEEQEAKEALDNVLGALQDRLSDADTERLLHSYQRRYSVARNRIDDLRARSDAAEDSLRERGAFLAQSELLDFIHSHRYRPSPMSLANAMAGLPFINWRQSTSRCIKEKASHAFLNIYELFLEVKRALDGPPRTAKLALEQVKAYLKKGTRKNEGSIRTLRNDWYYLRVAIEAAYSKKPPKDAIPYRVFAEYCRRSSSRSQLDQVLAREEKL